MSDTDELQRYIDKCRELSVSGLPEGERYEWWSRLAEILEDTIPGPWDDKPRDY